MKSIGLFSTMLISMTLPACSAFNGVARYRFQTGEHFTNDVFSVRHPDFCLGFENEFNTQKKEVPPDVFTYDISKIEEGSETIISEPGKYILTGKNYNTSFRINTTGIVTLYLNEVNLTSIGSCPIKVEQAQELKIHVLSGTKNYISDAQSNNNKATIVSNATVSITGKGFLYINGYGEKEEKFYASAIYSEDKININDTKIVIPCVYGVAFKATNEINIINAKISVEFGVTGGFESDEQVSVINSTLLYTGSGNAITGDSVRFISSQVFILSFSKYSKVKESYDQLSHDNAYFIKESSDYIRVNLDDYDDKKVIYTLDSPSKGIVSNSKVYSEDTVFFIDVCDDGIYAEDKIESINSDFCIKANDQAIFSNSSINLETSEDRQFMLKIFQSYEGIVGNSISINGGYNFIVSSESNLGTIPGDDHEEVKISNDSKVVLDTEKFGVNTSGSIYLDRAIFTVFGANEKEFDAFNFIDRFSVNNSTILALENKNSEERFNDIGQATISNKIDKSLRKNEVIHYYDNNFKSSVIIPKVYENLHLTVSSPNINKDKFKISCNGFVDYEFENNFSINKGTPTDDKILFESN